MITATGTNFPTTLSGSTVSFCGFVDSWNTWMNGQIFLVGPGSTATSLLLTPVAPVAPFNLMARLNGRTPSAGGNVYMMSGSVPNCSNVTGTQTPITGITFNGTTSMTLTTNGAFNSSTYGNVISFCGLQDSWNSWMNGLQFSACANSNASTSLTINPNFTVTTTQQALFSGKTGNNVPSGSPNIYSIPPTSNPNPCPSTPTTGSIPVNAIAFTSTNPFSITTSGSTSAFSNNGTVTFCGFQDPWNTWLNGVTGTITTITPSSSFNNIAGTLSSPPPSTVTSLCTFPTSSSQIPSGTPYMIPGSASSMARRGNYVTGATNNCPTCPVSTLPVTHVNYTSDGKQVDLASGPNPSYQNLKTNSIVNLYGFNDPWNSWLNGQRGLVTSNNGNEVRVQLLYPTTSNPPAMPNRAGQVSGNPVIY